MTGAPPTPQNIQPQISRGVVPRENGCPARQPIIKGLNSETDCSENRSRRQAVLDRQGSRTAVDADTANSDVLPWAICGRSHGAGECDAQGRLENIAPLGPGAPPAGFPQDNTPASFYLKSRQGPCVQQRQQASWRPHLMPGKGALMTQRPSHLRLVPREPQPRSRRIEVRISAMDGRALIGRTRLFTLSDRDLAQLIVTAERMEARASWASKFSHAPWGSHPYADQPNWQPADNPEDYYRNYQEET